MVRLPKNLLNEVNGIMKFENRALSDFICQATRNYIEDKREENIQKFYESMKKGYEEMDRNNITIASEDLQAEDEAEHTIERQLIGVWSFECSKRRGLFCRPFPCSRFRTGRGKASFDFTK